MSVVYAASGVVVGAMSWSELKGNVEIDVALGVRHGRFVADLLAGAEAGVVFVGGARAQVAGLCWGRVCKGFVQVWP